MPTANEPNSTPKDVEDLVEDVLAEYLSRRMAGKAEPVADLLAAHPEHAELLGRRIERLASAGLLDAATSSEGAASDRASLPEIPGLVDLLEIGRGGMGVVYRARQPALGRDVAVKVMHGIVLSERLRERFEREVLSMGRIRHPHVVSILDAGVAKGLPYLVMGLIEGRSLALWLPQRASSSDDSKLPVRAEIDERVRLIAKIARALGEVHERGVIHRDVKPSNVLVTPGGEPVLIDFGLARDESGDSLTHSGDVVGTVAYMSPEQTLGKHVDARTDVYGAAATLYHLVTGMRPYPAQTLTELALRMQRGPPPSARAHNPAVGRDLAVVLEKSLASDPRDRYATARDLADDLEAVLEHRPIQARRVGAFERSLKWLRRRPTASALILVSALACLLALNEANTRAEARRDEEEREYDRLWGGALGAFLGREKNIAERLIKNLVELRPDDLDPRLLRVLNIRQNPEGEGSMSRSRASPERTREALHAFEQLPLALREEPAGTLLASLLKLETSAGEGVPDYSGIVSPNPPSETDQAQRFALVLARTPTLEAQAEVVLLQVLARTPKDGAARLLHAALTRNTRSLSGYVSAEFALAEASEDPFRLQLLALHKRAAAGAEWGDPDKLRQEGMDLVRRAIELDPDDPTILNNGGLIARDAKVLEEAETYYRRAIQASPQPLPRFNLANLLELKDVVDHQECYDLLTSVERAYGHRPTYWDRLAEHRQKLCGDKPSVEAVELLLRGETVVDPADRALVSATVAKYGSKIASGPQREDALDRASTLLEELPGEHSMAAAVLDTIADCVHESGYAALKQRWSDAMEAMIVELPSDPSTALAVLDQIAKCVHKHGNAALMQLWLNEAEFRMYGTAKISDSMRDILIGSKQRESSPSKEQ